MATHYHFLPAQRSILRGDGLAEWIAANYDLESPIRCDLLSQGDSDTYGVVAGDARFALRICSLGKRLRTEIEAEAQILELVTSTDLPAARPIKRKTGQYVLDIYAAEGLRYAVLFAHVDGSPAGYNINAEQSALFGRIVGRLHNLFDCLTEPFTRHQIDLAYLLDEPLRIAAPFLSHRPRDARYLDEIVEKLKRKVGDLPRALPEWGLCHGDLHKTNIMVDKHGQVAIIDWDCAGYGWRAYDLAVLRWSIGPAVGRDGIGAPRLSQVWEAYLHHYQAIRPLNAAEIEAIPYFVAIRHIRVLGWEINNATSGPWGINLLSERFFDEYIGTLKGWEADELA